MLRVIGILLLLLIAARVSAMQAPATFTFGSSQGEVFLRSTGWIDADRLWFVASAAGANDLPFSGSPCAQTTASNPPLCTIWGVVNVREGRLLSLQGKDGVSPSAGALVAGRLFIAGATNLTTLPHIEGSPIPQFGSTSYLIVASPMGDAETGSYLPSGFRPYDIIPFESDIVLAGLAPCASCLSTLPTRLLRLSTSLTDLRYDSTLPGSWYPFRHVVDHLGRIHFSVSGRDLPTTPSSMFPQLPSGPLNAHEGGVVVVNADNGALAYATYLHTEGVPYLEWDPGRNTVWVLGNTRDQAYPLTADAVDSTFCEGSGCVPVGCVIILGQSCNRPQEVVLSSLEEDGSAFRYATYVGGDASDHARAVLVRGDGGLAVLTVSGAIGPVMSGYDSGTRVLTNVYPEALTSLPSERQGEARWSANAGLYIRDNERGDLYVRGQASGAGSELPVVHLAPGCDGTVAAFRRCFSILWLPSFAANSDEPQHIPGPHAIVLLLLASLLALTGYGSRLKS